MKPIARAIFEGSNRIPIVREPVQALYRRYFDNATGHKRLFYGVYPSFAAAVGAVPSNRSIGYDNDDSARRLLDELDSISSYDYPILFWLDRILLEGDSVFDWGGYLGNGYYSFRKYLKLLERARWIVSDVDAIVRLGTRIVAERQQPNLIFTSGMETLDGADILLAAGSLQFIEDPLADLERSRRLPTHILINKTPAYEYKAAVTIQNMGTALAPYHLFNRLQFISFFTERGYHLVDSWSNRGLDCYIPFHPEHSLDAFSGFYFRKG